MQGKSALTIYRSHKQEIRKEQVFDNSRGSSLLFEARTGVLRTKTYRAKFEKMDTLCAICQNENETMEHLVLECTRLRPALPEGSADLTGALGFADEDGRMEKKRVTITKRRLENWWIQSRENETRTNN
uniref:Tick transposon n=2 Tax=Ixodes ricinus TaxID=34613 RepID=A0A147BE79_IXORI